MEQAAQQETEAAAEASTDGANKTDGGSAGQHLPSARITEGINLPWLAMLMKDQTAQQPHAPHAPGHLHAGRPCEGSMHCCASEDMGALLLALSVLPAPGALHCCLHCARHTHDPTAAG